MLLLPWHNSTCRQRFNFISQPFRFLLIFLRFFNYFFELRGNLVRGILLARYNLGDIAFRYQFGTACRVRPGNAEMARLLIEHGATIDVEDSHGNTPLWRAVFNSEGRGDLIRILLHAGADRQHVNKHGKTPLGLAETIANYDELQFFEE